MYLIFVIYFQYEAKEDELQHIIAMHAKQR
jgi:hypothetical protein